MAIFGKVFICVPAGAHALDIQLEGIVSQSFMIEDAHWSGLRANDGELIRLRFWDCE
jgi:hypothetical protein